MAWEQTAIGLCAAGIGCGLLQQLAPEGATKRVLSVLIAVFFFGCFLSPLSELFTAAGGWIVQASEPAEVPDRLNEEVSEQIADVLETALCQDANERLASQQVTVRQVRIHRDTAHPESIYIERADVVFAKEDYPLPQTVVPLLEQAWGVVVEVYYVE